jgi:hypothetical protein
MKKILLLTILILGYYLTAFSQSKDQLKIDTTLVKFGFPNSTTTFGHINTIDYKQFLDNPEHHKFLPDTKLAGREVYFGHLSNSRINAPHSFDNMPCLYPQGSFTMPVYRPDSAVNYTLLIKKYK